METQSKLFEHVESTGERVGARRASSKGMVVIRASTSAIYGTRNSEYWIPNGLQSISFSDLVFESSGHLVLPIDLGNEEDRKLVRHISQTLNAFVKLTERSGQRFTGKRINDVGKRFEYMIADELRKTPLRASVLGRPGYPDCVLLQDQRVTYLEIKTSASIQKLSNKFFHNFSYSSGKKIEADARHLLLKVRLEEEGSNIWKVVSWELRDLSTLKTRLKTAFNAGFSDLADVRLLGSSDGQALPSVNGQSVLDVPEPLVVRTRKRRRTAGG